MTDFLFKKDVADYDQHLADLVEFENERQARRLIMIPSESMAPLAVRKLLGSSFQNIYAEGYPRPETRYQDEETIMDYGYQLGRYRRHSDPRYYKGVEYIDMLEALARRRAAELFAANGHVADDLWVNVQPLSGAPANTAVFTALLKPGDAILGMDLLHGGHLTHGAPVNRSGLVYNAYHYTVDPKTERLDYDAILKIAQEVKPKILIAGYTSYPWIPDWQKFREIADEVGAYFLADASHIAGLVAAGVVPSPVGIADIVSFTTHKTLCGPRGAVLITQDRELGEEIDKGVFPGEQGGPHMNSIAALALALKLATKPEFKELQQQTLKNTQALIKGFKENGARVAYGGSDSHMALIDCKNFTGPDGTPLTGDLAARILDLVGIVTNRNTVPGDRSALTASGIRMGTTWLTQRGFREAEMEEIAGLIVKVLDATKTYPMPARSGEKSRAKVDFCTMNMVNDAVRKLADSKPSSDEIPTHHGYPHYFYASDKPAEGYGAFQLTGEGVRTFLNYTLTNDIEALDPGQSQPTRMHTPCGDIDATLTCVSPKVFKLTIPAEKVGLAGTWLNGISTGFVYYDEDLAIRIPGPISILPTEPEEYIEEGERVCDDKPWYIAMPKDISKPALPEFVWEEPQNEELKRTVLHETHIAMGAKMVPFAGFDMPVWYSSVMEEHRAVREAAGLFDVTHMGVFQCEGPDAAVFLDSVSGNDTIFLEIGESVYSHFLDPHGKVIDDFIIYRRDEDRYLLVVNAANEEKDWAWLTAVKNGEVLVDLEKPWVKVPGRKCTLRNLKDPAAGEDQFVTLAIQGPASRDILLSLACDHCNDHKIMRLGRGELCDSRLGNIPVIISRTGYTGEALGFEVFVHPDNAVQLWKDLLEKGKDYGLVACGLAARDSLRTEAGLPLYGHEMGGDFNLTVGDAGFISFVRFNSAWFIGRAPSMEYEKKRKSEVARFTFNEKGVRMARPGDPVCDLRGRVVGYVTSCAIDQNGMLTGQAYVDKKVGKPGTSIHIFQNAPEWQQKPPAKLVNGDRVAIPSTATIVKRFL